MHKINCLLALTIFSLQVLKFVPNDKIMATKNNDVPVYVDDKNEDGDVKMDPDAPMATTSERLMNGSTYIVKQV